MFEMVETCGLCGGERFDIVYRDLSPARFEGPGGSFGLVRCRACGFVVLSPRPVAGAMGAYYPGAFYASLSPAAGGRRGPAALLARGYNRVFFPPSLRRLNACLAIVSSAWPRPPGRLLDIGAGEGAFMEAMKRRGWDVSGTDVSAEAARRTSQRLGATIRVGPAEALAFESETYDLVTLWDVLEHLHDPLRVLRRVRSVLRGGGRVLISVPNFGSLEARLLGSRWPHLDVPRHLGHFTAATLGAMLRAAGFGRVRVGSSARVLSGNLLSGRVQRLGNASRRLWVRRMARVVSDACRTLSMPSNRVLEKMLLAQSLVATGGP